MHGLTAAWHCHRLGIDVAVSDPCDLMRRPFNYGPLWLPLAYVAPSFSDALGFGLGLLFILSLVALPPAQSLAETGLRVATTLSTTIVFALERGNPDLVIFMLVLLAGLFMASASRLRFAAYALVIAAGLLALRHHAQEPGLKRLCAAAVLVTVLLMWRAFFDNHLLALTAATGLPATMVSALRLEVWLLGELAWWFLISVMGAAIAAQLGETHTGKQLAALLRRIGIKAARAPV